jgi:sirohydrochlorin ferrochelatase
MTPVSRGKGGVTQRSVSAVGERRQDGDMTTDPPALLTIAHGTRDPRGAEEMDVLLAHLRERVDAPVGNAWLEDFSDPNPVTAATALVEAGAERIVTVPFLVLGAGHAKTDVPGGVADIRTALSDVTVAHGRVLDLQRGLFDLALERVSEARRAAGLDDERPPGDELLLVTGAGSSDPDANGDLAKAARYLAEATGHRWVDVAYAGVTWPRADLALRRAAAAGASRVTMFSWSLLAGLLEARVTGFADEVSGDTGLEVVDAGRFGPDPKVADAVVVRYREAIEGDPRMNCDLCQYRLPFPRREERAGAPSPGGTGERVAAESQVIQDAAVGRP